MKQHQARARTHAYSICTNSQYSQHAEYLHLDDIKAKINELRENSDFWGWDFWGGGDTEELEMELEEIDEKLEKVDEEIEVVEEALDKAKDKV